LKMVNTAKNNKKTMLSHRWCSVVRFFTFWCFICFLLPVDASLSVWDTDMHLSILESQKQNGLGEEFPGISVCGLPALPFCGIMKSIPASWINTLQGRSNIMDQ